MENVADALKYALGMFLFVLSLTIALMYLGKANSTAKAVFALVDDTNFQSYIEDSGVGSGKDGRIVGIESIIPTLYRYYKENYIVKIYSSSGTLIETFDSDQEAKIFGGYTDERGIYHQRQPSKVPWMGNPNIDIKLRVDLFISGKKGIINTYYTVNYLGKGLIANYGQSKFRENIRVHSTTDETAQTTEGEVVDIYKRSTKMEITYTEL